MAHLHVQDPAERFCGQCGLRVTAKDERAREGRCGDCNARPVPLRFCRATGVRLDPPPPERRSLLGCYLGSAVCGEALDALPTLDGRSHYARGESLSSETSRSR